MKQKSRMQTPAVLLSCFLGVVSAVLHWLIPTRILLGNPAEYACAAVAAVCGVAAFCLLLFGFVVPYYYEVLNNKNRAYLDTEDSCGSNTKNPQVNKARIGVYIVLSVLSLGLFLIYWQYLLVKNVKAMKKDSSSCKGEMLCLVFVPFYSIYWWYTRGKALKKCFGEQGYSGNGNEVVYLILGIFGLSIVSMAIMQSDFNSLPLDSSMQTSSSVQSEAKTSAEHISIPLIIVSCWSLIGLLIEMFATVVKLIQGIDYGFVPVQSEGAAWSFSVLILINVPVLCCFAVLYLLERHKNKA